MSKLIQKGLAALPVVGEILFVIVLTDEVVQRVKDWRKRKQESSTQEPVPEEPGGDD